jgi:uncharacterized protein involved in exopolysaccharide biosynthesis
MTLRQFISFGLARWRQSVLVGLLFIAGGVALAFLLPVTYRVNVVLAPAQEENISLGGMLGQFGGLAELAGLGGMGRSDKDASLAMLKSRSLTQAFMAEENLLPAMYPEKWDEQNRRWKGEAPTLWEAFDKFDKRVRSISEDRRTGIITLSISWRDAPRAAQLANALVERCNLTLRRQAIDEAARRTSYLQKQIEAATAIEVRQLLFRLLEGETKKMAVAATRDEFAFRVIDPGTTPTKRDSPHRSFIVIVAAMLGGLAALGLLFLQATLGGRTPEPTPGP